LGRFADEHGDASGLEQNVGEFLLSPGENHEVVGTERFGAAHVVIAAGRKSGDIRQ
jgi:hypothetical protein